MKKIVIAASLAASALFSSAAFAQASVGVTVGQSDFGDCAGAVSCDNKGFGTKIFGGYKVTENFGVEGGYVSLGKASATINLPPLATADLKASGLYLAAVATAPINDFELFAKLGFAYLDTKIDMTIPGFGSASDSEKASNVMFGVGAGYNFTKNIGVRAEFERFKVKYDTVKGDVNLLSVGLRYSF